MVLLYLNFTVNFVLKNDFLADFIFWKELVLVHIAQLPW